MEELKTTKLSPEELETLTKLRQTYAEVTANIGRLNLDKYSLNDRMISIDSEIENSKQLYKDTITEETKLVDSLNEKYGQGRIDLETGVFTSDK